MSRNTASMKNLFAEIKNMIKFSTVLPIGDMVMPQEKVRNPFLRGNSSVFSVSHEFE